MTEKLEDLGQPARQLRTRFEAEIEPYRRELWRYCLRLAGSAWDAEDLVQEAMQRAFAKLAELWQPINPRAYLFRITTNAWLDRKRHEVRREAHELQTVDSPIENAPEMPLQVREGIAHVVSLLTPLQRAVFLLRETLDFKAREAAALLGTSEGAVKIALHRARRRLVDALPEAEEDVTARLYETSATSELVQRYLAAFDARDPNAIAALLHEHAVTTIVGSAQEIGRDVARRNSLAEWAEEPGIQQAQAGQLEGRPAIFVFSVDDSGRKSLYSLIQLHDDGAQVHEQRIYFFCPELLEHAAAALGVPAQTHGHQYPFEAAQ